MILPIVVRGKYRIKHVLRGKRSHYYIKAVQDGGPSPARAIWWGPFSAWHVESILKNFQRGETYAD